MCEMSALDRVINDAPLRQQVSMAGLFFTPFLRDGSVFPGVNVAAVAGLADLARKVSAMLHENMHACRRACSRRQR